MSHMVGNALSSHAAASCLTRLANLRQQLAATGMEALLVSSEKDIWYLTGFVGHDSLLLVTQDCGPVGSVIISDNRYHEHLELWRKSSFSTVVMGVRHRLADALSTLCKQRAIRTLVIQAEHVTLASFDKLAAALVSVKLVQTTDLVSTLRMRKDPLEIALIEKANDIGQQALAAVLERVSVGMSELEFSAELEYQMKLRGAFGSSFTPIIAAGANSALPHHLSGTMQIQSGVLLVDWGATVDGYNGDLTRTFGVSEMPRKIREVYPIVLEAQLAAIEAIAPGKRCADIDAVARSIITEAGYGEQFGHGLGHGLGMDVHEGPYFNNLQTDVILQPDMVMTVEPGIYLPGVGGVRIEDDIVVTDDGSRLLSDYPKDLASAIIEPVLSRSR